VFDFLERQSAGTAKGAVKVIAEVQEELMFKRKELVKITGMGCPASFC
jgi:hypothetical protein